MAEEPSAEDGQFATTQIDHRRARDEHPHREREQQSPIVLDDEAQARVAQERAADDPESHQRAHGCRGRGTQHSSVKRA